jgi:hypothetical protein
LGHFLRGSIWPPSGMGMARPANHLPPVFWQVFSKSRNLLSVRARLLLIAWVVASTASCDESRAVSRAAALSVTPTPAPSAHAAPREGPPDSLSHAPEPEPDSPPSLFLRTPDHDRRTALAHAAITRVKKGKGGRSLAFKLTFDDGTAGYYKPEQTFSGTIWFAEVVAHALDRALGMNRVPPVVSRRISWSKLERAAEGDDRVPEVIKAADHTVRGALIAWLDEPLVPAVTPPGWENWIRVEPFGKHNITPFQRASEYVEQYELYKLRRAEGQGMPQYYAQAPRPGREDLPGALSDMITLDFLLMNIDRFGGNNGNILTLGEAGPLIFLDNSAGLSVGPHRRNLPDQRFFPCQRFRKATIEALEKLDVKAFVARLEADPLALPAPSPLTPQLIEGIEERRKSVLEHVTALRRKHGDTAVLSL